MCWYFYHCKSEQNLLLLVTSEQNHSLSMRSAMYMLQASQSYNLYIHIGIGLHMGKRKGYWLTFPSAAGSGQLFILQRALEQAHQPLALVPSPLCDLTGFFPVWVADSPWESGLFAWGALAGGGGCLHLAPTSGQSSFPGPRGERLVVWRPSFVYAYQGKEGMCVSEDNRRQRATLGSSCTYTDLLDTVLHTPVPTSGIKAGHLMESTTALLCCPTALPGWDRIQMWLF